SHPSPYLLSFHPSSTTPVYTLSLHDALPISRSSMACASLSRLRFSPLTTTAPSEAVATTEETPGIEERRSVTLASHLLQAMPSRSEEHTSELQSRFDLVCRLLLEKKNIVC